MGKKETQIIIDRNCNVVYSSYYILGLNELFGKRNIRFDTLSIYPQQPDCFCFLIREGAKEYKYAISLADSYCINEAVYDWCDVYGSVNANYDKTPEKYHKKLVPLCPSFGVRCWNFPETWLHAIKNWPKSGLTLKKNIGMHKRLISRPLYSDYCLKRSSNNKLDNYIFFLSTLWYSDEWNKNDEGVNARRANFIHACKTLDGIVFEGGLVSQGKERSSEGLFADCLSKEVSMKEWMRKTKRSALVFNTPAFWDCHGWKLGEYLAMGKCILSTELSNDLPVPLEHGKNIHLVDNDQESMRDAIEYIITHPDYRKKLENGAKAYWEHYGSPVASLKLLGIKNDT